MMKKIRNPISRTNKPLKKKIFRITDGITKTVFVCFIISRPAWRLSRQKESYMLYHHPAATEGVILCHTREVLYIILCFFQLHAGRKSFNVGPYLIWSSSPINLLLLILIDPLSVLNVTTGRSRQIILLRFPAQRKQITIHTLYLYV